MRSQLHHGFGMFISEETDPFTNLALEEALFDGLPVDSSALVLYVNRPSVIIGRHQNPWKEAAVPYLKREGIPVARRISGGGTVFHDTGNLNFSFLMPKHGFDRGRNLDMILEALRRRGVDGRRSEMHDLMIEDRKFSGNSFCFRRDRALHHGTILVSARLSGLSLALAGAGELVDTHAVRSRPATTMNLTEVVPSLSVRSVEQALCDHFGQLWDCGLPAALRADEETAGEIDSLLARNRSWEWIFGKSPAFEAKLGHDAVDGNGQVAELSFHVENGLVGTFTHDSMFPAVSAAINGVKFDSGSMFEAVEHCVDCAAEKDLFLALLRDPYF